MQTLTPLIIAGVWLLFFFGLLGAFIVWYSRSHQVRWNFYITDIWAAMLGLTPTIAFFCLAMKTIKSDPSAIFGAAVIGVFQCAGIVLGKMFSEPFPGETLPRQWDQAGMVLIGAMGGLLLLVVYLLFLIVLCLFAWLLIGV